MEITGVSPLPMSQNILSQGSQPSPGKMYMTGVSPLPLSQNVLSQGTQAFPDKMYITGVSPLPLSQNIEAKNPYDESNLNEITGVSPLPLSQYAEPNNIKIEITKTELNFENEQSYIDISDESKTIPCNSTENTDKFAADLYGTNAKVQDKVSAVIHIAASHSPFEETKNSSLDDIMSLTFKSNVINITDVTPPNTSHGDYSSEIDTEETITVSAKEKQINNVMKEKQTDQEFRQSPDKNMELLISDLEIDTQKHTTELPILNADSNAESSKRKLIISPNRLTHRHKMHKSNLSTLSSIRTEIYKMMKTDEILTDAIIGENEYYLSFYDSVIKMEVHLEPKELNEFQVIKSVDFSLHLNNGKLL